LFAEKTYGTGCSSLIVNLFSLFIVSRGDIVPSDRDAGLSLRHFFTERQEQQSLQSSDLTSYVRRLVLFLCFASPLSRWAKTRDWQRAASSRGTSLAGPHAFVYGLRMIMCVCYSSFIALLPVEERSGCAKSYICSRIQKHRCHTQRTPPECPSP
jgi:hypothetical protein